MIGTMKELLDTKNLSIIMLDVARVTIIYVVFAKLRDTPSKGASRSMGTQMVMVRKWLQIFKLTKMKNVTPLNFRPSKRNQNRKGTEEI